MFIGIFEVLQNLIDELAFGTVKLIDCAFDVVTGMEMGDFQINLVLFSDTPILQMNLYQIVGLFFSIFYSIFFIVLLYKVTKKIIKSVFGVLKWW